MIPKNRIRLSRTLRSQISPYPNAGKLLKRGIFLALLVLTSGIYFFTAKKPQPQPAPLPKQILGEQEQVPEPQFNLYKVKKGDTLFNLGQNLGVSWQTLAEINNIPEPYLLKVGREIKIPK